MAKAKTRGPRTFAEVQLTKEQMAVVRGMGTSLTILANAAQTKVSQTVKLDNDLYIRLATFSAKTRASNQKILVNALIEYLEKYDR